MRLNMNNKGFAVSGILYSILVLFLMLLLLILGNFHSRKVAFDKQKSSVLNKLQGVSVNNISYNFCYKNSDELQLFETPSDGVYKLEIYGSNNGGYASGEIRLYQGIVLYVLVGKDGSISSIRTESNKLNTVILSYNDDNGGYAYTEEVTAIDDIAIGNISNVAYYVDKTQEVCTNSGYVKISRIGD